jgi:hypothetical protein
MHKNPDVARASHESSSQSSGDRLQNCTNTTFRHTATCNGAAASIPSNYTRISAAANDAGWYSDCTFVTRQYADLAHPNAATRDTAAHYTSRTTAAEPDATFWTHLVALIVDVAVCIIGTTTTSSSSSSAVARISIVCRSSLPIAHIHAAVCDVYTERIPRSTVRNNIQTWRHLNSNKDDNLQKLIVTYFCVSHKLAAKYRRRWNVSRQRHVTTDSIADESARWDRTCNTLAAAAAAIASSSKNLRTAAHLTITLFTMATSQDHAETMRRNGVLVRKHTAIYYQLAAVLAQHPTPRATETIRLKVARGHGNRRLTCTSAIFHVAKHATHESCINRIKTLTHAPAPLCHNRTSLLRLDSISHILWQQTILNFDQAASSQMQPALVVATARNTFVRRTLNATHVQATVATVTWYGAFDGVSCALVAQTATAHVVTYDAAAFQGDVCSSCTHSMSDITADAARCQHG